MIQAVGIEKLLPDMRNAPLAEAVKLYRSFACPRGTYAKLEKEHGAFAIGVEPVEPVVSAAPALVSSSDANLAIQLHQEQFGLRVRT